MESQESNGMAMNNPKIMKREMEDSQMGNFLVSAIIP